MASITVTDKSFDELVVKSDVPFLVDFWAVWCTPCQTQGPIIEAIAEEFVGKIKVGKVNVDENPETAGKYGIMSIPTLMIFKGGTVVKQLIGLQSKEMIASELNKLV